jgi:hypothetical protein
MMNTKGPLRYFQILYCLCHTSPPTSDFLPFVISHLKGFTMRGNQNGLTSLKAEEDFQKEEHEQRLAKLREKKEFDDKESELWKDRPSWYSEVTGMRKKTVAVAPPPRVLTDVYKVNIGKGIIAQYAECCTDMIHRVVKLGEKGKSPSIRINEDHIKHLQMRAPFLTKVSLDFFDEEEPPRKGSKPNMFQQVRN